MIRLFTMKKLLLIISIIISVSSCGIFNSKPKDQNNKEPELQGKNQYIEAPKHNAPNQSELDSIKKNKTHNKQEDKMKGEEGVR